MTAQWQCAPRFESYPGIVHGGIVATILDAAMTQCLLRNGVVAVTGQMQIEYESPLRSGEKATVYAAIARSRPPLYLLSAEVLQDGAVAARAMAKFMRTQTWSDPHDPESAGDDNDCARRQ